MRHPFQGTCKDGNGRIIQSATVTAYLVGTSTLASIYTASTGGTAVNSITAGTDGNFIFWADPIDYRRTQRFDIIISSTKHISKTYSNIVIFPYDTKIYTSDYTLFSDALTDAANNELVIDSSINLDVNTTIPTTVSIHPIQSGVINANGKTLTINGPIVGNPMHKIFNGFTAGGILGLKEAKVEWFGAVGDGTTDDSTALQLAFDWWLYSSNRRLKMNGRYRANSMLSMYAVQLVENSRNCVLDAYGAAIESYVNGSAVHIGKDGEETTGTTARMQYNIIKGLKIQAMNTSVHTLLRIGGQYSYGSWFEDIHLKGYSSATRTTQGLLFFGRHNYYNTVTNIRVEDCKYEIVNGRDMNSDTYVSLSEPCNANRVIGALLYEVGIHGIALYNTAGNRFTHIDFEGGASVEGCRDVYIGKGASNNIVSARHERITYSAPDTYTHEFESTISPLPTGNTIESNHELTVLGSDAVKADNIQIKLSSTNGGFTANHLRSRYLYNHAGQPISIRQNQFLAGEDAIMVNVDGVHLSNCIQPLTTISISATAGKEGEIRWDANYIYICTVGGTPGTWKRVGIATW